MERLSAKLIEKILKRKGAVKVSKKAKKKFAQLIKEKMEEEAVLAVRNASVFGRKIIKEEDIIAAQKRGL